MYSVSAYTFVYQSGETGSDIFILIKGDLVLVDVDRDGIIGQLCPGAMFGVSGAIDIIRGLDYRPRRKENVYALSGCDMLKISLEDFLEIIITYPDILPPFEEYFEEFSRLTATKNSANLNNAVVVWRSATSGRNGPMAHPGRLRMDDRHVASARKLRLDMMEGHSADLLERVKRLGLMWRDRARFMGR